VRLAQLIEAPKVFEGNRTALASIYGFRTICDVTQGNQTTWVLLGKHKSDGQDYDMYKKTKGGWIRCDKDGHPIGTKISEEQMRGLALIKPATTYCNNPIEVEAEALTALRLGGATLARFIAECPELYNIVQQRDQEEIDRVYGAGWMRDINGRVVRRTSTSEEEYRQFMAKAQAQGEVA